MLAAECKIRYEKESKNEITQTGDLSLKYSTKNSHNVEGTLLCTSKCFLRLGEFDKDKTAYQKVRSIILSAIQVTRSIVIIDDSKAISIKLKTFVEKLGYSEIYVFDNGLCSVRAFSLRISIIF